MTPREQSAFAAGISFVSSAYSVSRFSPDNAFSIVPRIRRSILAWSGFSALSDIRASILIDFRASYGSRGALTDGDMRTIPGFTTGWSLPEITPHGLRGFINSMQDDAA